MVARALTHEVVSLEQSPIEISGLTLQRVHQLESSRHREKQEVIGEVELLSRQVKHSFLETTIIDVPDPEQFVELDWKPRSRFKIQKPLAQLNPDVAQIVGKCNQAIDTAMAIAPEAMEPLAKARAVNTLSLRGDLPIEQLQTLSPGIGSAEGLMTSLLEAERNANQRAPNVKLRMRELVRIPPVSGLIDDFLSVCDFEVEVADLPVSPPLVLTPKAIHGDRTELGPIREILDAYTDLLVKTKRTQRAPDDPPYLKVSYARLHGYLRNWLPGEFENRIKEAAELLLNENYGPLGETLQTLCLLTTSIRGLSSANEALRQRFPRW